MDIKKFAQNVQKITATLLHAETQLIETLKLNGTYLHGLRVTEPQKNISLVIYLEPYYRQYLRTGNLPGTVAAIIKEYHSSKPVNNFDVGWFRDFNQVKAQICYRLINYWTNKELLDSMPHSRFLDLAKAYYVFYQANGNISGHIPIYNSHLTMWGIAPDRLDRLAETNTPTLHPPVCAKLEQFALGITGAPGLPDEEELDGCPQLYVLTNSHSSNGAAAMCYDGPLRNYSAKTGKDTIILPSSIHELILTPLDDANDISNFRRMVQEINTTQLAPANRLSDNVYIYRKDTGQVEIA